MVWYENLDRSKPYLKNFRGWNLWYNYNNGNHHEMKRLRTSYIEHWLRRMGKHESNARLFASFVLIPLFAWLYKTFKRFKPLKPEEEAFYNEDQYVATIGRNQYGYETRAAKSFEHVLSIVLGKEILNHILSQDSDSFKQEEIGDEDNGLVGDFSEDDILSLRKNTGHDPHVGVVFFRPDKHYLNEKPNDFLSPYKVAPKI